MLDLVANYFEALFSLTSEMAPYLLLGFIVAGALHVYVPRGAFTKWFGKNNLKSVLYASIMGIPLPLCSCGVIPTGISLHKEGASKGATVSFLISTPQTGVDSIMVTYSLLGLPFAIVRPIIAFITGVLGGWAVNKMDPEPASKAFHDPDADLPVPTNKLRGIFSYAFDEFLDDISDWLVIGLALAGVIAVLIPESFFQSAVFENELLSMLIVLIASIPFYVCATGSVPIAAVLLMKGLNPGAVLVFLMAGPATNVATITVISQSLGKKTLMIYLSSIVVGAFVFGWILNHFFPSAFFAIGSETLHEHGGGWMYWVERISAVLFLFLLMRIYLLRMNRFWKKKQGSKVESTEHLKIGVEGMSCENCATKVESALLNLEGVNESKADFTANYVEIKGNSMDLEKIRESVEKAGYRYTDVKE